MLSENIYVNEEGINIPKITSRSWVFNWKCDKCNSSYLITKDNIEDFINSDAHDPLQDYLVCPMCDRSIGLFKGVEGKSEGIESRLWADGSFIYLSYLGKDERVV